MKKILSVFLAVLVLIFVSCEPQNQPSKPSGGSSGTSTNTLTPDKLEGSYVLDVSGSIPLTGSNGNSGTHDMTSTGKIINIAKSSSNNSQVVVTGYYGTRIGEIKGNKLYIEGSSGTSTSSTQTITVSIEHNGASLSGTQLTWTSNVTIKGEGRGNYSGTVTGTGTIKNIAKKM